MKAFNHEWMVGRPWGLAHPRHNCYADADEAFLRNGDLHLGITLRPRTFDGKRYPWGVGFLTSQDVFKYGLFEWRFVLPLGRHLWPALWLTDADTWPPEIDVLEGWSGRGLWPLQHRPDYLRLPWCHYIHPGLVHPSGTYSRGYGSCGDKGVWRWQLHSRGINHCSLLWTPDGITVRYNGHAVMDERRPEVLKVYNESRGMHVTMNNYTDYDFSYDDFQGIVSDFIIKDFKHQAL